MGTIIEWQLALHDAHPFKLICNREPAARIRSVRFHIGLKVVAGLCASARIFDFLLDSLLDQLPASQTPQRLPVAMASSISAYFFKTAVRYSGAMETACSVI